MRTKSRVKSLDKNLRHSPTKTDDFVSQYCETFREFAYATRDDSINEFEKLITHVLGMNIYYARYFEIIGHTENFDPREFVDHFEWLEMERQSTINEINKKIAEVRQA